MCSLLCRVENVTRLFGKGFLTRYLTRSTVRGLKNLLRWWTEQQNVWQRQISVEGDEMWWDSCKHLQHIHTRYWRKRLKLLLPHCNQTKVFRCRGFLSFPQWHRSTHIIGCLQEPVSGRLGVGDGLLGGERLKTQVQQTFHWSCFHFSQVLCLLLSSSHQCVFLCVRPDLGCDDEECGLCVQLSERLGQMSAIDVGDEPNVRPPGWVWLQSLRHHQRTLNTTRQQLKLEEKFLLVFPLISVTPHTLRSNWRRTTGRSSSRCHRCYTVSCDQFTFR